MTPPLLHSSSSSQEWFHRWEGRKHLVKSTEADGLDFQLRNQNKVSFHEGNGVTLNNTLSMGIRV